MLSPLPCQAGDHGATARFGLLICNSGWSSEPWRWEVLTPPEWINPLMLLGMGDIHSQLDCKALTDIEGSGAARQGIANCPLDRRNKKPSDFSISVLIQHSNQALNLQVLCHCGIPAAAQAVPGILHSLQANQSDCQCGTVINLPRHNVTGYHKNQ